MSERPVVVTQVIECSYPVTSWNNGFPSNSRATWTKSIRAEGSTETQALKHLKQEIDRYQEEEDKDLPPTVFYAVMFGCRRVGEPKIERKLTLWDSVRRFLFQIAS